MTRKINIGATYRHFKGMNVKVMALAKDSEDLHPLVVYYHVDKPEEVWVRDLDEFLSPVDHEKYPDVKAEYRFEEIEEP